MLRNASLAGPSVPVLFSRLFSTACTRPGTLLIAAALIQAELVRAEVNLAVPARRAVPALAQALGCSWVSAGRLWHQRGQQADSRRAVPWTVFGCEACLSGRGDVRDRAARRHRAGLGEQNLQRQHRRSVAGIALVILAVCGACCSIRYSVHPNLCWVVCLTCCASLGVPHANPSLRPLRPALLSKANV